MKDLDEEVKIDTLEVSIPQKKESQLALVGQLKPHKGHTLFEFNIKTREIVLAKFEERVLKFNPKTGEAEKTNRRVLRNEDCIYVSALNKQNAIKKIFKIVKQHL